MFDWKCTNDNDYSFRGNFCTAFCWVRVRINELKRKNVTFISFSIGSIMALFSCFRIHIFKLSHSLVAFTTERGQVYFAGQRFMHRGKTKYRQ